MAILKHSHPINAYDGTGGDTSASFDVLPRASLVQILLITGVPTGTAPTLDFYVQGSWDGGATYKDIARATQLTANGGAAITIPVGFDTIARVQNTVNGARTISANSAKQLQAPPKLKVDLDFGGTITTWQADVWVTQY